MCAFKIAYVWAPDLYALLFMPIIAINPCKKKFLKKPHKSSK